MTEFEIFGGEHVEKLANNQEAMALIGRLASYALKHSWGIEESSDQFTGKVEALRIAVTKNTEPMCQADEEGYFLKGLYSDGSYNINFAYSGKDSLPGSWAERSVRMDMGIHTNYHLDGAASTQALRFFDPNETQSPVYSIEPEAVSSAKHIIDAVDADIENSGLLANED